MLKIIRGVSVVLAYKIFGVLSLLVINMMIGQYYGPEKLGIFSLITALLLFSSVLSRLGLDVYVLKVIPLLDDNYKEVACFIKKILIILLSSGLLVSLFFFIAANFLNVYIFKSIDATHYILGIVLVSIPFAYIGVLPEIFRGFGGLGQYSFFKSVCQNLCMLILIASGLIAEAKIDPIYALYLSILITLGLTLLRIAFFLKARGVNIFSNDNYKKPILKYSYPMMLTSSMMLMIGYAGSFMISHFLDVYYVGIYSACLSLSVGIIFIQNSINVYIAPIISKLYASNSQLQLKKVYYNSLKLSSFFAILIFLVLNLYSSFFLGLFGEKFSDAGDILFVVTLAFLINAFFGPVGYMLNMTGNQKVNMRITCAVLSINIILNVLFIPTFGLLGAALASLSAMVFKNLTGYYYIYTKILVAIDG